MNENNMNKLALKKSIGSRINKDIFSYNKRKGL